MIYEKNNKQMRELLKKFGNTNYGKCMFIICYLPFMILMFITLFTIFTSFLCYQFMCTSPLILKFTFATLISFCLGSYGYYKELKDFVNYKKTSKK